MNIMYCCMYRRVDRAGQINLLCSTELYEYYVLVYVQEDGYARTDTSARYNGTILHPILSYTFCHR